MNFWWNVLENFTGGVLAAALIVEFYAGFQWFLRATDVTVSYCWEWKVRLFPPAHDIHHWLER